MNSIVNRVSTSPQSLPQTLSLLPTDKISTPNPNPAAAPTALALLVAATEQSHYLPAETPAPPPPPVVAAMPDSDPNHPTAQSQSNESIPQDVAFSPGRAVSAQEGGRIPKKDLPAPNGMFEGLQLPPGVVLPDTVTPDILAGKPIRMLLEVSLEYNISNELTIQKLRVQFYIVLSLLHNPPLSTSSRPMP